MANILSLPPEILLGIIEGLVPRISIVGDDATYHDPSECKNWWALGAQARTAQEYAQEATRKRQIAIAVYNPYNDLLSLRQTCRLINELCIPFLYHDLNLFDTISILKLKSHPAFTRYLDHVRTFRFEVLQSIYQDESNRIVLEMLESCQYVTTLAICYNGRPAGIDSATQISFANELLFLMERKKYSSIGIYHSIIYQYSGARTRLGPGLTHLLDKITGSPQIAPYIQVFELSLPELSSHIYSQLRSNLIGLNSLSIRRGIEGQSGHLWEPRNNFVWESYQYITHLQLINCVGAHAEQIPPLIYQFPSLRSLLVSGCGSFHDKPENIHREVGWSSKDGALSRVHKRLDSIRIEHMWDWELMALGVIPVKTLVIACIPVACIANDFGEDNEIFPGLQELHIDPRFEGTKKILSGEGIDIKNADSEDEYSKLEKACTARGILLKADAYWLVYPPEPSLLWRVG